MSEAIRIALEVDTSGIDAARASLRHLSNDAREALASLGPLTGRLESEPDFPRTVEGTSLAGRVLDMVGEAQKAGRLSSTEAQVVMDLIWHPAMPGFFRDRRSAPAFPSA